MNMKKIGLKGFVQKGLATRIGALILSTTLVVGMFTGCGKSVSDKDEQGRTIVSVGGWPTNDGPAKESVESRKAKFEESNKDVVIVPDEWSFDIKTFYAKAVGGNLPTVFNTHFTEISQMIGSGYSADLTKSLKKYGIYDKINKNLMDIISKDGKVYVLPHSTYALGLAYNVDLLTEAGLVDADGTPKQPKDWNEVVDFAIKIKDKTGKAGFAFPTSGNNGGWIFTSLAWSFGAEFVKKDKDGKWQACFDSKEATQALQWVKDLKWKYDVVPVNTLIDGAEIYKLFGTGEAGMIISAGDLARKVNAYAMQPDQLGIMAIPAGPKKRVSLMGGGVYAVSSKATDDQVDAAVRWLVTAVNPNLTEILKTSKENAIKKSVSENELVTIKSLSPWNVSSEAVKFENKLKEENANGNLNHVKLYNEFIENPGNCEFRPEVPICAQELYGILDSCIQEVFTNKNADPAAVLKKAKNDFQANYLDNLDY